MFSERVGLGEVGAPISIREVKENCLNSIQSEKQTISPLFGWNYTLFLFWDFGFIVHLIVLIHISWTKISLNPLPSPQAIREAWERELSIMYEAFSDNWDNLIIRYGGVPHGEGGTSHSLFIFPVLSVLG